MYQYIGGIAYFKLYGMRADVRSSSTTSTVVVDMGRSAAHQIQSRRTTPWRGRPYKRHKR